MVVLKSTSLQKKEKTKDFLKLNNHQPSPMESRGCYWISSRIRILLCYCYVMCCCIWPLHALQQPRIPLNYCSLSPSSSPLILDGPLLKLDRILKRVRDYPTEIERSRAIVRVGDEFTREFGTPIPPHLSSFAQRVSGIMVVVVMPIGLV